MVGMEVGQEPGLASDAVFNAAPKPINDEVCPRHLVPLRHRHLRPATFQTYDVLQRLTTIVVATITGRKRSVL